MLWSIELELLQLSPCLSTVSFRRHENEAFGSEQELLIEGLCDFLILNGFLCFFSSNLRFYCGKYGKALYSTWMCL